MRRARAASRSSPAKAKVLGDPVRKRTHQIREEDGQPYYKVRIEPERNYFLREEQRYDVFPGTQIMASIRTGTRTVVEYLLDPFLGSFQEAMRER